MILLSQLPNNVLPYGNVLVFGTDDGLRHLASSTTWFLDQIFNVAPSLFSQLYVIRAPLSDSSVTFIYGFLINNYIKTLPEVLGVLLIVFDGNNI